MSTALLKETCDKQEMKTVAMVDDVFDPPETDRLDAGRYRDFRAAYNKDELLRQALSQAGGATIDVLPRLEDLDEAALSPIWRAVWRSKLGQVELAPERFDTARALFESHKDDVLGMLDLVSKMLILFKQDLEREVTVHGTDYDADELASADVVLVDFFLGTNLTPEQALELSTEVVIAVAAAARRTKVSTPSFLLVSSQKEDVDVSKFRERAQLMKSRFRFFPKQELTNDNTAELVSLHDLIEGSKQAAVVEKLIEDWRRGAGKAVEVVFERMMDLDVSDLVYLDFFRLTREGTTVGNYLRWFLTASLSARVTGELDKALWAETEKVRLFDLPEDGKPPDTASLAKTFDGPTAAIADAYGDVLFDESRGTGDHAFPGEIAANDLVEGDLFVRPGENGALENATVLLVMTPSCDLVQRAPTIPPTAGTVLLLSGTMKSIRLDVDGRVIDQTVDYVRVRDGVGWGTYHLKWDLAAPVSVPWTDISANGPGEGFRRLGRIRELYFHKIRERFAAKLTRIGTEVPPLFPRPKGGSVVIRRSEGKTSDYDQVLAFDASEELLWEFGKIKLAHVAEGKLKEADPVLMHQASRKLIEKLGEALAAVPAEPAEARAAADRAQALLKDMTVYISLMRPMKPGTRTSETAVRVLQPIAPGTDLKGKMGDNKAVIVISPHDD